MYYKCKCILISPLSASISFIVRISVGIAHQAAINLVKDSSSYHLSERIRRISRMPSILLAEEYVGDFTASFSFETKSGASDAPKELHLKL